MQGKSAKSFDVAGKAKKRKRGRPRKANTPLRAYWRKAAAKKKDNA
jgi:hypothetical protein